MIVTVDYAIERGPDIGSGTKFGQTTLDRVRAWRIQTQCAPLERRSNVCQCRLTRVDIVADCIVRLNPRRIARSFFDPDPRRPRGYVGRRVNGQYVPESPEHFPLDEESVMVHERSHCKDIADAIQASVKQALEQVEASLVAQCACEREDLCDQALLAMVAARLAAIGTAAYEELLRDADEHKTGSATEGAARRAQIDDFNQRDVDDDGG